METITPIRKKLIKAVNDLPIEALPELANFLEYLRYKVSPAVSVEETQAQATSGSAFLISIAGLGASEEDDISERDEEILANEIDSIRGWGLKQDNSQ